MHPMKHAVKERLVGCQLIMCSKQSQRFPMGRSKIYENQTIPRAVSRPRREVGVAARNKSGEVVVLYGVPNDQWRRRQ